MRKIYRQGDVLLSEIDKLPSDLVKDETNVLMYGEVTGHKHQLLVKDRQTFQVYQNPAKEMFLEVFFPTELVHEEHKTITLPKGVFSIGIEREYDPFEKHIRQVQD